jgi:membrane protein implicated in regulation of membrane protease activity
MFASQLLTLITGVASVLAKKRFWFRVPVMFCLIVIVLMMYVGMTSKIDWSWQYQEGFWLTVPSLFLFLTVSVLESRQQKNTGVHNQPENANIISNAKEAQV